MKIYHAHGFVVRNNWGAIVNGHIIFNIEKSWREIPELYNEKIRGKKDEDNR